MCKQLNTMQPGSRCQRIKKLKNVGMASLSRVVLPTACGHTAPRDTTWLRAQTRPYGCLTEVDTFVYNIEFN